MSETQAPRSAPGKFGENMPAVEKPPVQTPFVAEPEAFARALINWQREAGRKGLPWMVPDAYQRWLSEIMLQQTQVAVVQDYFARFLKRFPTVADLAAADEAEVMALWAGLGYYARARNLMAAARMVVKDFNGVFPVRAHELERLPGVGKSTAAAVASFCSGEALAICDGNVKRVLARVLALDTPVDTARGTREVWAAAQEAIETSAGKSAPGTFNQAMMDLGAMLCTRTKPSCARCPVAAWCRAHRDGHEVVFPKKSPPREKSRVTLRLALVVKDSAVLLVRRPARGIWPLLYCLPEIGEGVIKEGSRPAARIAHELTHRRLDIEIYALEDADVLALERFGKGGDVRRAPLSGIESEALPAPIKTFLLASAPQAPCGRADGGVPRSS